MVDDRKGMTAGIDHDFIDDTDDFAAGIFNRGPDQV
jgi:hypothetical protein